MRVKLTLTVDVPDDAMAAGGGRTAAVVATAAVVDALAARDITATEVTCWNGARR